MNNNKLVVNTDLNTTEFDNKYNKLEKKAEEFSKKDIEKKVDLEVKDNFDSNAKDIYKLSEQLEDIYNEYNKIRQSPIISKTDLDYSNQLKQDMLEIAKQYKKITGQNLYIKGINDIPKSTQEAEKGFNNLINKIKRTGLALFSLGSIYALVSKASSAYLSQDTKLAEKLQSVWIGLGSFLAPALEAISNVLLKALGYLNVFIRALTGTDYLSKVNTKSVNKQAQAYKNLNKQLVSNIDEITNLNDETSNANANIGNTSGFKFDIPDLDNKIVKKLEDLAYLLKENEDLIKKVGLALVAVFGIKKTMDLISNIGKFGKALGSLPKGISIGLTLIGVASIIDTISKIKKDLQELEEWQDGLIKNSDEIYSKMYEGEKSIDDLIKDQNIRRGILNDTYEKSQSWTSKITGLNKRYLKDVQLNLLSQDKILEKIKEQYKQGELDEKQKSNILQNLIDQYNIAQKMIPELEKQGINTDKIKESTKKYGEEIGKIGKELGLNKDQIYDIIQLRDTEKGVTDDIYSNIKQINNTKLEDKKATYTVEAKADTKKAEKDYSNFFTKIGEGLSSIFTSSFWKKIKFSIGGRGGGGGGGRAFADGGIVKTVPLQGVVYNPGPGVNIGGNNIAGEKGAEVIFPLQNSRFIKDFANEIASKLGDGTNTQLLLDLNRNLMELANRPVVLNVNGKSFAQATYSDYKNEQKRQNENTQIIRS